MAFDGQLPEADEIARDVQQLDRQLDQLKREYDQYFLGMAKIAPMALRNKVQQMVRRYANIPIQNTALKFRFNALTAKYNAFVPQWDRTMRQIEEGTYKRDVFRMKLKDRDDDKPEDEDPKTEAKGKATAGTKKVKAGKKDAVDKIYDVYVKMRTKNNESIDSITRDKLAKTIEKQTEAIKKRFNCKSVSFKVVTEDGKTKLKAIPK